MRLKELGEFLQKKYEINLAKDAEIFIEKRNLR